MLPDGTAGGTRGVRRLTGVLALLLVALAASRAPAQGLGAGGTSKAADDEKAGDGSSKGSEGSEGSGEVPDDYASPRATMRTFWEAMHSVAAGRKSRIDEAIDALDLTHVPEPLQRDKGHELAAQLKEIVDRLRYFRYEELPADPKGDRYVFHEHEDTGASIVIARQDDGWWRFSRSTVKRIPELYRALEDQPLVEELRGTARYQPPSEWLRSKMPEVLKQRGFLLEHWQWLGLLAVLLIGILVQWLVTVLLELLLERLLKQRDLHLARQLLHTSLRPFGLLAMALFWRLGVSSLGMASSVMDVIGVAVAFVATVAGVWGAYRLVDVVTTVLEEKAAQTSTTVDDLLVPLCRKAAKVLIFAFGILFIAQSVHIDISSLLAGVGLGGLAVALAAQDAIKNFFGSVTVLLDRSFTVGDWTKIEDVEGMVEELGFRSTRIRTFYNSLVTIPNSRLLTATIDNMGMRQYRRWYATLYVPLDTPPDRVEAFCEGIRELIRRNPHTRKDFFEVRLRDFHASGVEVMLYIFFDVPDWATEVSARHELVLRMIHLGERLGVRFSLPGQTVYLQQDRSGPSFDAGDRDGAGATSDGGAAGRDAAIAVLGGYAEARSLEAEPATSEPGPSDGG